ncbi:MAG: M50 family metallopeptidase [Acidimicrobiales bacterium]
MTDGAEILPTDVSPDVPRQQLLGFFAAAVVASIALPLIPYGRYLFYPFALLGTWAHEMGHGLMAMLLGGSFEKLEVYQSLGGVAYYRGLGDFASVLVAMAGLLGPAILGAIVIMFGARPGAARRVLAVLGVAVLLSIVLFVRNAFGVVSLGLIGAALVAIGFLGPARLRVALAQLIGVQFCLTSLGTLDYMFTSTFVRDGATVNSDTQAIAEVLFLPYWFWGGLIAALSFLIMGYAIFRAWIRPSRQRPALDAPG